MSARTVYTMLEETAAGHASKPALHTVRTPSGPLQIVAVPWITRSGLMAKDDLKNLSVDEMNRELLWRGFPTDPINRALFRRDGLYSAMRKIWPPRRKPITWPPPEPFSQEDVEVLISRGRPKRVAE